MAEIANIRLKKKFGQHFLQDNTVLEGIINKVRTRLPGASVFEVGCGDGALTEVILQTDCARLWVFEIDPEWAAYVQKKLPDARLTMMQENILDVDFAIFEKHKPWILLANLPYQITFPFLYRLKAMGNALQEAVIMIQEEVAQKLVKTRGRDYGLASLFFQRYFTMELLQKVPPEAFYPPPKVYSRLLYLKPKADLIAIEQEEEFWHFIKICFKQPRRTLRNNLAQTHIALERLSDDILALRPQQMNLKDLVQVWDKIRQ